MFESALFLFRLMVGLFFTISGYHKLFNEKRHNALVETLKANNIPWVAFNQYWVPFVECFGGIAVVLGLLFPLPLFGLLVICLVALCTDGMARVKSYKPIDAADWLDDVLYLPETLYLAIIALLIAHGYGALEIGLNVLAYLNLD